MTGSDAAAHYLGMLAVASVVAAAITFLVTLTFCRREADGRVADVARRLKAFEAWGRQQAAGWRDAERRVADLHGRLRARHPMR